MAGDWIKVEHVTPDKPEIYQLASVCGITPEDAFGRCLRIWIWADQQSLNGHALTVTFVTLDAISRRDGFATALCKVKWLIDNGDGTVTFPNFDRHNGKTAKTRATANDRKQSQRERDKETVTKESRSERDISVTREEKNREDKKPSVSNEKIVFDGSSFQNTESFIPVWESAYPALDVRGELAKAAAWLIANPKNKKSQYGRFLNGWLSRAQDRAPRVGSSDDSFWKGVL